MRNKHVSAFAVLMLVSLLMPGCFGYKLGSSLPPDIRSVFIPTFVNDSKEPLIEVEATNATISEFQRDGTLKIVGEGLSDVVLECTLTSISLDPLRYSQTDRMKPNEYRLTLNATFVLRRSDSNEVVSKGSAYGESTFIFTGNLTGSKRSAIPAASEDLAKRIVESVVETWW